MPLSVCQQAQVVNIPFLLTDDCRENEVLNTCRLFRKHMNRCKTGSTGRPVNIDFRNELCRTLLDKFKQEKITSGMIHTVATHLAKKHPFSLDNSLQRMQFRRRWCSTIQYQLASGKPLRRSGTSGTSTPVLSSFSLDSFCSTCVEKAFSNVHAYFPQYQPSIGLLVLIEKVQVKNNNP